jgi:hypothetical protein
MPGEAAKPGVSLPASGKIFVFRIHPLEFARENRLP